MATAISVYESMQDCGMGFRVTFKNRNGQTLIGTLEVFCNIVALAGKLSEFRKWLSTTECYRTPFSVKCSTPEIVAEIIAFPSQAR